MSKNLFHEKFPNKKHVGIAEIFFFLFYHVLFFEETACFIFDCWLWIKSMDHMPWGCMDHG